MAKLREIAPEEVAQYLPVQELLEPAFSEAWDAVAGYESGLLEDDINRLGKVLIRLSSGLLTIAPYDTTAEEAK